MTLRTCSVLLALAVAPLMHGQDPEWRVYYGNLHSHSSISDGRGTPAEAFDHADEHIDFMCLSEHNHMTNDAELTQVRNAANASTTSAFVGIVGQEYSTIRGGNHINIHNVWKAVPASLNKNYKTFYEDFLPEFVRDNDNPIVVGQFNHPESTRQDYGIAPKGGNPNYQGNWDEFVANADPWVSLIAVISGPSDSSFSGSNPPVNLHRDSNGRFERAWRTYLDKGFHLSPVADQDNHRRTWGEKTTARTGVWVRGDLTRDALLQALKDSRTFATEDDDLSIWFAAGDSPMGSRLEPDPQGSVDFTIRIEDGDEPNSSYRIDLFHDTVGDDELSIVRTQSPVVRSGETWEVTETLTPGARELFYARVRQVSNSGPQDDAFTAPIWFEPGSGTSGDHGEDEGGTSTGPRFSWSRRSNVFHFTECSVVQRIAAHNLQQGDTEPDGKRLHHNCPFE